MFMAILTVVIPAYNEENGILAIVNRVLAIRPQLVPVGVEELDLVVVDDGSRDCTAEKVLQVEGVRLIRHEVNKGYGAALKTGFAQARGELIGFLDADGTYPPEYFPQLCAQTLNGTDLAIGSRMAGADSQMPLTRRIGNLFFAGLLSVIGRARVTDSASGMRVFRREILDRLSPLPDGLNLTPVMSTRALHEHIRVTEVPIPYSERVGRSKLSVVRDGRVFLQSMVWTVLSYNPMRVLGLLGLGGIAAALAVGLGLVALRLSGVTTLGPWGVAALFWGLVSGVTGVSLFALGITFNYLVSLFYHRPVRQGLFGWKLLSGQVDRHFGWLGLVSVAAGLGVGVVSAALGVGGWEMNRLWLYLLGSAMLILMGVQLVIYWVLLRVLEELSQREAAPRSTLAA
jgi:glycosyltransferase involved in cell wall biosynthesis